MRGGLFAAFFFCSDDPFQKTAIHDVIARIKDRLNNDRSADKLRQHIGYCSWMEDDQNAEDAGTNGTAERNEPIRSKITPGVKGKLYFHDTADENRNTEKGEKHRNEDIPAKIQQDARYQQKKAHPKAPIRESIWSASEKVMQDTDDANDSQNDRSGQHDRFLSDTGPEQQGYPKDKSQNRGRERAKRRSPIFSPVNVVMHDLQLRSYSIRL